MKTKRTVKIAADIIILICSSILLFRIYIANMDRKWFWTLLFLLLLLMVGAAADLVLQVRGKHTGDKKSQPAIDSAVRQLILLDEQNKPVKSWDLSGKIAVVIGKKNQDEEVDVDLEDCEYSTFINPQHAALNFCQNFWYIEDLGSQNGVQVEKVEDGVCYKVLNRPCRVMPGDIIYIANTKLLLT